MTGYEFAANVRLRTRTDSATLTDTNIVLMANTRLEMIARAIMRPGEDTLVLPQYTNLIINRRNYAFPSNFLSRIKYVEVKFATDGEYIHLDEFDIHQYRRPTDEDSILANFSNDEGRAFYEIYRRQLSIYSGAIVAVVNGIKLWCTTYPRKMETTTLLDSVTDLSHDPSPYEHGVPQELHELWMRGVCIDYKTSREKPIPLTDLEMKWDVDLERVIADMRPSNLDRSFEATIPPASTRGNNGQDY